MGLATNKDEYIADDQGSDPIKDVADFKEAFGSMTKDDVPAPKAEIEADKTMAEDAVPAYEAKAKPAPAKQSFSQAFAAARKAGEKVFEYNGKKYTTEMKGSAPAAKPAPQAAPIKPSPVSTAPKSFEPKVKPKAERPSVYADNFLNDAVKSIKSKLDEKGSDSQTLVNGKRNLTAAQ